MFTLIIFHYLIVLVCKSIICWMLNLNLQVIQLIDRKTFGYSCSYITIIHKIILHNQTCQLVNKQFHRGHIEWLWRITVLQGCLNFCNNCQFTHEYLMVMWVKIQTRQSIDSKEVEKWKDILKSIQQGYMQF